MWKHILASYCYPVPTPSVRIANCVSLFNFVSPDFFLCDEKLSRKLVGGYQNQSFIWDVLLYLQNCHTLNIILLLIIEYVWVDIFPTMSIIAQNLFTKLGHYSCSLYIITCVVVINFRVISKLQLDSIKTKYLCETVSSRLKLLRCLWWLKWN